MDRLFAISVLCGFVGLVAGWLMPGRWRPFLYLAVSFAWWCLVSWYGLLCLLAIHLITCLAARCLGPRRSNRGWHAAAGVGAVILPLVVVKISGTMPADDGGPLPQWANILGISYYTFQCIGYLLDVHWNSGRRLSLMELVLLGAFFPRAAVGPIERAQQFAGELQKVTSARLSHGAVRYGAFLVTAGVFMKLVLAERLASLVTTVHGTSGDSGALASGLAIVIFPWQLYYDFAGYTLVALGFAHLLGIRLTNNFNRPFFATTVSEFWQRWHISLSGWFRDYVYTPFRFKMRRKRTLGIVIPTITGFVFIGLWHEIGMLFMIFGLCHGGAVACEGLLNIRGVTPGNGVGSWVAAAWRMLATFTFVALTLVFFRAENLAAAGSLVAGLSRWVPSDLALIFQSWTKMDIVILAVFVPAVEWLTWRGFLDPERGETRLEALPHFLRWGLYALLVSGILVLGVYTYSPFIYARF